MTQYTVGTGAIIFQESGSAVLLIQEHKAPDRWGIVGGKLEAMSSEDNLLKEILEETGYAARIDGLIGIYHRYDTTPQRVSFIYRATALGEPRGFDDTEVIKTRWFSLPEIPWDQLRFDDNRRMLRDAIDGQLYPRSAISSFPEPEGR
jgi:ADP-ribose pyrophosphatase YjhB (NUDIX family)